MQRIFSLRSHEWFPHIGLLYSTIDDLKDKLPTLVEAFEVFTLTINKLRITKKTEEGFITIDEIDLRI